jgi:hypothetical protein
MQFIDVVLFLVRLCIFGPLIFLALLALVDPLRVIALLNKLADEVYKIEASQSEWPVPMKDFFEDSESLRFVLRTAGVLLASFSLVHLVGIL